MTKEEKIKKAYEYLKNKIIEKTSEPEIIGNEEKKKTLENKFLSGYYYDYQNVESETQKILKYIEDSQDLANRDKRYDRLVRAADNPEIDGAIKIHADEATTKNVRGEIYNVYHSNVEIKKKVMDMFDRIGLSDLAWQSIYNFCLMGDEFREIIFTLDGKRIGAINYIPPKLISRVERNSVLQYFTPREPSASYSDLNNFGGSYYWDYTKNKRNSKEEIIIEPFRILHSRINSFKYSPYGESIIDKQIGVIEKLNLMEQALLIARLTRSPERRLYNVVVGNLQGEKALQEAVRIVERLKRKKVLDFFSNSKTDKTVDFWGSVEDIIIPRRNGEEASTVETLPGINNTSENGDIEFIRDRLFPGFVPRQYIYDDTFSNANQALSNKNIPFAKKIRRIQQVHLQQVYKLAVIELSLAGYSYEEIKELTITMNNPSNLDEKERLELQNSIWSLISSIKSLNSDEVPFYPDYLIYRDILNLTNEEILLLLKFNLYQRDKKNFFYIIPKHERPRNYEDLDELLNPELDSADIENEEENADLEEDYDSDYDSDYETEEESDESTEEKSEDEYPSIVDSALSDMDIEKSSQQIDKEKNAEKIYLEKLKRKALIKKQKLLKKQKELLEKELKERQILNESIDDLKFEDLVIKLSGKIKNKEETKLNVSLEYLETKGEFSTIDSNKLSMIAESLN